MTTGFFADKMNAFCELNKLPYIINASPAYHLDDVYHDYDVILVAPQLRYKAIELAQRYHPITVKAINPVTFATYDCQALLNQIEECFQNEVKV